MFRWTILHPEEHNDVNVPHNIGNNVSTELIGDIEINMAMVYVCV